MSIIVIICTKCLFFSLFTQRLNGDNLQKFRKSSHSMPCQASRLNIFSNINISEIHFSWLYCRLPDRPMAVMKSNDLDPRSSEGPSWVRVQSNNVLQSYVQCSTLSGTGMSTINTYKTY